MFNIIVRANQLCKEYGLTLEGTRVYAHHYEFDVSKTDNLITIYCTTHISSDLLRYHFKNSEEVLRAMDCE